MNKREEAHKTTMETVSIMPKELTVYSPEDTLLDTVWKAHKIIFYHKYFNSPFSPAFFPRAKSDWEEIDSIVWSKKDSNDKIREIQERIPDPIPEMFQKAEGGDARAQYNLAHAYIFGELQALVGDKVEVNGNDGIMWLHKAAEQDNVDAADLLGRAYCDGRYGLKTDYVEGIKYLRKACELGHDFLQTTIAYAYIDSGNISEAIKLLREIAKHGDIGAELLLGCCLLRTKGPERNETEGIRVLQSVAERGDPKIQKQAQDILREHFDKIKAKNT